MPRNIEIKARIGGIAQWAAKVAALADRGPFHLVQDDTFFACESGRLKLREFSAREGELIFYRRPNQPGPKESFFVRCPTENPGALRQLLSLACGQAGRVVKTRCLFFIGRTRVHLDRVEGLGDFLELEVVLDENEPCEGGVREAHHLMAMLGIGQADLVEGAYLDLLAQNGSLKG